MTFVSHKKPRGTSEQWNLNKTLTLTEATLNSTPQGYLGNTYIMPIIKLFGLCTLRVSYYLLVLLGLVLFGVSGRHFYVTAYLQTYMGESFLITLIVFLVTGFILSIIGSCLSYNLSFWDEFLSYFDGLKGNVPEMPFLPVIRGTITLFGFAVYLSIVAVFTAIIGYFNLIAGIILWYVLVILLLVFALWHFYNLHDFT